MQEGSINGQAKNIAKSPQRKRPQLESIQAKTKGAAEAYQSKRK